jgi:hypothetical protein
MEIRPSTGAAAVSWQQLYRGTALAVDLEFSLHDCLFAVFL